MATSDQPLFSFSTGTARIGRSASMGIKLLVLTLLTLIMSLFALWISSMVDERTERQAQVAKDIAAGVGGAQLLLGPTVLIPYTVPSSDPKIAASNSVFLVSATDAKATVKTRTEERRRSLFRVPVFNADADMHGTFDLSHVASELPPSAAIHWKDAEIVIGISDVRGAKSDAIVRSGDKQWRLQPSRIWSRLTLDSDKSVGLFGTTLNGTITATTPLDVSATMTLSGAQRIAVLAYGRSTRLTQLGDWRSPGFDGSFPPVTREISQRGFRATWNVPFIARGVSAEDDVQKINGLAGTAMGVSLIEVADPYQSVTRALKFAPLFLALVFLSYFVFEATTGHRVHVAQYVLVGVAQLIFYLLLLSFAEHIGFTGGFAIGGGATVLLLSANAGWIFASRVQALRALGIFGPLYTMIFLLLRLEDNALLVGAIFSFAAVSAAMYVTRSMDWFGRTARPEFPGNPTMRVGEL